MIAGPELASGDFAGYEPGVPLLHHTRMLPGRIELPHSS